MINQQWKKSWSYVYPKFQSLNPSIHKAWIWNHPWKSPGLEAHLLEMQDAKDAQTLTRLVHQGGSGDGRYNMVGTTCSRLSSKDSLRKNGNGAANKNYGTAFISPAAKIEASKCSCKGDIPWHYSKSSNLIFFSKMLQEKWPTNWPSTSVPHFNTASAKVLELRNCKASKVA